MNNNETQASAINIPRRSINTVINGTSITHYEYGVNLGTLGSTTIHHEGLMISDTVFVDVKYGVYYPVDSTNWLYWLAISNSHFDVRGSGSRALSIYNGTAVQVNNCLFIGEDSDVSIEGHFQHSSFTSNSFNGGSISLLRTGSYVSAYNVISQNMFGNVGDSPTVPMPAIKLALQTYRNVVTGNTFQQCNDKYTNGYQEPSPIQELNTNRTIYKQIIANNIWENITDY